MTSLRARVQQARARLIAAGIPPAEAALDAELLARDVLGWDRATLLARVGEGPPPEFDAAYDAAIARRHRREPVAYITGRQEFWGRDFVVGPDVLIPRPETELLIEEALEWARTRPARRLSVVDIGTGSGCLAVTLALELPGARVEATDVSEAALALARENATRLGAQVAFHHGPMLAGLTGPVDLLVANPPYVTTGDYATLQPEVAAFEPEVALVGGADGLDTVRQVIETAGAALAPGGRLLMEIGHDQGDAVTRLVADARQLVLLRIRPDLQGTPRAVVAERRR